MRLWWIIPLILLTTSCSLYQSEGAKCLQEGTGICDPIDVEDLNAQALDACQTIGDWQVPQQARPLKSFRRSNEMGQYWLHKSDTDKLFLIRTIDNPSVKLKCEATLKADENLDASMDVLWLYSDLWIDLQP